MFSGVRSNYFIYSLIACRNSSVSYKNGLNFPPFSFHLMRENSAWYMILNDNSVVSLYIAFDCCLHDWILLIKSLFFFLFLCLLLYYLPSSSFWWSHIENNIRLCLYGVSLHGTADGADWVRFPLITHCQEYENSSRMDGNIRNVKDIKTFKRWQKVWRVWSAGGMLRAVTTKHEGPGI